MEVLQCVAVRSSVLQRVTEAMQCVAAYSATAIPLAPPEPTQQRARTLLNLPSHTPPHPAVLVGANSRLEYESGARRWRCLMKKEKSEESDLSGGCVENLVTKFAAVAS